MANPERWFGSVSMEGAPVAAHMFLDELLRVLDVLRPDSLAAGRSWARVTGHDWAMEGAVEFHLGHSEHDDQNIDIVVGKNEAIVSWLSAHEHVYEQDGMPDRHWTTVVADAAAAVLRGEYVVEDHYRGERLVKTRVIDVADPSGERAISVTCSLGAVLSSWLPRRARVRVERRRVDYAVDG